MTEYLLNNPNRPVGLLPVNEPDYPAGARVIRVGVDKQFRTIGSAVAAARDGDVILVDAGTYTNDFARVLAKLTIIGVGGMVNMVATIPPPDRKGIMTVGNDLRLENFTFKGAAVSTSDGGNGAGIRYEGGNLVLVNDAFIGNQNGLMGGAGSGAASTITIDHSLFSGNGSGSGNTHNLYVGQVGKLVVTNSIFENAVVGHELKSRAMANTIDNNLFRDGPAGTASYSIDLPNGGKDVVTNNVIEKGPKSQNTSIVHFGGEAVPYDGSFLVLEDNVFINDKDSRTIALLNQTTIAAEINDNTFINVNSQTVVTGPAILDGNVDGKGVAIANLAKLDPVPGSTLTFNDSAAHSVTLGGSTKAVQGGAGRLTVTASAANLLALGGSGGMDYTDGAKASNNQITTKAGSSNTLTLTGYDLVDSRGTDAITIANGNSNVIVRGTASVTDGTGNDTFTVTGSATITARGGTPVLNVGAGGYAVLNGTLPFLTLNNNGGRAEVDVLEGTQRVQVSFTGGSASMQSWSGASNISTGSGGTGSTIQLGLGTTVIISGGKDVIWAGAGKADVIVKGQAEIHAGTGELTVWGHSSTGATFYGNGGTYGIDGNGGNITYYGGDKDSTINARLSNVTLVGGAGRLTITGAAGWQTITGGSGGINYNGAGGSANVRTAAGSMNSIVLGTGSVDSWGRDGITTGLSNTTLTLHGDAVVTSGGGTNKITAMGHDTVNGRGIDYVTATAGADVTINAGAYTWATEKGANITLKASAGNATLQGGSGTISVSDSQGIAVTTEAGFATNVTVSSGSLSMISRGADQIHTGSGASTITVNGGGTEIWGSTGTMRIVNADFVKTDTLVVHGGAGAVSINPGGNALSFIGGSGSAVIASQYGSLYIQGGAGAITASGGNLGTTFVGGSGNATLGITAAGGEVTFGTGNTTVTLAGGKATVFDFIAGHGGGTDIIKGFRVGTDKLVMQGVGVQSQSVSGGAANLLLTDGTHLQLMGVTSTAKLFA